MEGNMASLRSAAPHWSLAGDKQLLDALQCLQQRIITKCQETNSKLEEMVTALDTASINLQNVNNKFMALSNSQFVESRVYDDDGDVTAVTIPQKEQPIPVDQASELAKLKLGLRVLESMHTAVTILRDDDSESDSDDDDVVGVVLKPKDMYSDRPLPHIIGSQAWKSKWHAGLLPDDSDSDNSTSKPVREHEQYSDSEPDDPEFVPQTVEERRERTISDSSSEVTHTSKQQLPQCVQPSPSDIAAELARRLGGVAQMPAREPEYSPQNATVRKVYKPEKPAPGLIFSDEPPPLEETDQSEDEYSQDDIFAELHKNGPYANSNKGHDVTDDLFGHSLLGNDDDIFGTPDEPKLKASTAIAKPKSTLFEDESEPELFVQRTEQKPLEKEEITTKKPIGGISLFGTNKNADSIGAAILKRNRRTSTSGEESGSEPETKPQIVKKETKEKDIFDDLFAKSEKLQKKAVKENIEKDNKKETTQKDVKEKKVDLFSDNIFDDIDDLFNTNIVTKVPIKEPTDNHKSLFDDEDDLFADLAVTKPTKVVKEVSKNDTKVSNTKTKSIFDSDDDLFAEKEIPNSTKKIEISKTETKVYTKNTSLFDDSDDELFSKTAQDTKNNFKSDINISSNLDSTKGTLKDTEIKTKTSKETPKLIDNKEQLTNNSAKPVNNLIDVKNLIDDDDDEIDDLFVKTTKVVKKEENPKNESSQEHMFDSDEDLFSQSDKVVIKNKIVDKSNENPEKDMIDKENILSKSNEKLKVNTKMAQETVAEINLPKDSETEKDNFEDSNSENDLSRTNFEEPILTPKPDTNKDFEKLKEPHIFEDEGLEDDLFHSKTKNIEKPNVSQKPVTLTQHTESEISKDFGETPRKPNDIFDDHDMEDDIFNTKRTKVAKDTSINSKTSIEKPNVSQKPTTIIKPPETEKPIKIDEPIKIQQDIFDNTDLDDNLFNTDNNKAANNTVDDIENKQKPNLAQKPTTQKQQEIEKPKVFEKDQNIFDDIDDEILNINKNKEKSNLVQKPTSISKVVDEPKKVQHNIFEDDIEDDLFNTNVNKPIVNTSKDFEKPNTSQKLERNTNEISENTESKTNKLDNMKEVDNNKNITETTDTKSDIFTDIFNDQPPIFEKPKERKKSKNVNALFDDDSDDEALFFKKNDPLEDKPEDLSPQVTDRLFDLFVNEPPAIDDFDDNIDDSQNSKNPDDTIPESSKTKNSNIKNDFQKLDDTITKSLKTEVTTTENKTENKNNTTEANTIDNKAKESFITKEIINEPKSIDHVDTATKKIGKLKPMNFNINVNTLLPGASPKKQRNEQTDGQISNSNEELRTNIKSDDIESKLVKSVSFEGDPESTVLDNKLSKDRPKIQIKRRPSTRRARREAVKKSGIDFGDDSTDNSSSIDDVPKSTNLKPKDLENKSLEDTKSSSVDVSSAQNQGSKDIQIKDTVDSRPQNQSKEQENSNFDDIKCTTNNVGSQNIEKEFEDINTDKDFSKNDEHFNSDAKDFDNVLKDKDEKSKLKIGEQLDIRKDFDEIKDESEITDMEENTQTISKTSPNRDVKSKIVYILNDEDIFNSKPETSKTKTENEDELFKNTNKQTQGITTLGKVYPETNTETKNLDKTDIFQKEKSVKLEERPKTKLEKPKTSLFDDSSDEELFGKKTVTTKKTTVFDSDSENELFGKTETRHREAEGKKGMKAKTSLFSDDDDDDLFGVKTKKVSETKSQPKTKEQNTKTTEVYEDPLSLFGGDDD